MTGRRKFLLTLLLFLVAFFCIQILLFYNRSDSARERNLLLNQYNKLKVVDPDAAKRALDILFKQNPHDQDALRESGFWYLREGDTSHALSYFQLAVKNNPKDFVSTLELAKLYILIGDAEKAIPLLKSVTISRDIALQDKARILLEQIPGYSEIFPENSLDKNSKPNSIVNNNLAGGNKITATSTSNKATEVKKMSERDKLLNEFYDNKIKNPEAAWDAITTLLAFYPDDTVALKEAGFYALSQKQNEMAFHYLDRAYKLTQDPKLAMQNGYILDGLGKRRQAWHYFYLATKNPDLNESYKAEIALINLRGAQHRIFPDPFFVDVYYNPLRFSRFNLLVHPIIARFGAVLNQKYQWLLYSSYRRTWDNRSGAGVGSLPQIYQDSTSIYGIGSQIQPLVGIPLVAFLEIGKARNLVADIEPHWRGDLRGGLAYFKDWGREAAYTFHPNFPFKYVADLYADGIYYSRYQNWIFTARFRPGVELFRYETSSIDLYFRGFVIEDTQREFYNNLFEYGLGVAFIPSNHYNIAIRYEFTQGQYLPAGGQSANPYGPNYHNNVIECDFYFRI